MAMPPQDVQPELALLAQMKQGDETAFVQLSARNVARSEGAEPFGLTSIL